MNIFSRNRAEKEPESPKPPPPSAGQLHAAAIGLQAAQVAAVRARSPSSPKQSKEDLGQRNYTADGGQKPAEQAKFVAALKESRYSGSADRTGENATRVVDYRSVLKKKASVTEESEQTKNPTGEPKRSVTSEETRSRPESIAEDQESRPADGSRPRSELLIPSSGPVNDGTRGVHAHGRSSSYGGVDSQNPSVNSDHTRSSSFDTRAANLNLLSDQTLSTPIADSRRLSTVRTTAPPPPLQKPSLSSSVPKQGLLQEGARPSPGEISSQIRLSTQITRTIYEVFPSYITRQQRGDVVPPLPPQQNKPRRAVRAI